MFKLYFNYNGWEKVGFYYTENDVINDMQRIAKNYKRYYFMVIERIDNCDNVITSTRSEEEFNNYIEEVNQKYNKHIEDISCVELKRLILKGNKLC